jgi:hypothetical protein
MLQNSFLHGVLSDLFSLWTSPHIMTQLIQEQIWQRFATFVSSTEYTLFWQSLFNMSGIMEKPSSLYVSIMQQPNHGRWASVTNF